MEDITLRQVLAATPSTATPPTGMPRARVIAQHASLVLAALLLSVACVPALHPVTAPDASPPIIVKVSDPLDVSAAPIYIAEDQGYFRGEGLDVQLVNVSQSEVVQAVATNQLQFGLTLPSPSLFNALEGGVPVKIVASAIVNKATDRPAGFLART